MQYKQQKPVKGLSMGYKPEAQSADNNVPGPGTYNMPSKMVSAGQTMYQQSRPGMLSTSQRFKIKGNYSPGPGSYNISSGIIKSQRTKDSLSSYKSLDSQKVTTDKTLKYKIGSVGSFREGGSKNVTLNTLSPEKNKVQKSIFINNSSTRDIGPGQYDINKFDNLNDKKNGIKFEMYCSRNDVSFINNSMNQTGNIGFYETNKTTRSTVGGNMYKAQSQSFVDKQIKMKQEVPGPTAYYKNIDPYATFRKTSFNKLTIQPMSEKNTTLYPDFEPGPGTYNRERGDNFLKTQTGAKFGKQQRADKLVNDYEPGPQDYNFDSKDMSKATKFSRLQYGETDQQVEWAKQVKEDKNIKQDLILPDSEFDKVKKQMKIKISNHKLAKRAEKIGSMVIPRSLQQQIKMRKPTDLTITKEVKERRLMNAYTQQFPQMSSKELYDALNKQISVPKLQQQFQPGPQSYRPLIDTYKKSGPSLDHQVGRNFDQFFIRNKDNPGPNQFNFEEKKGVEHVFNKSARDTQISQQDMAIPGVGIYQPEKFSNLSFKYDPEIRQEKNMTKERINYMAKQLEAERMMEFRSYQRQQDMKKEKSKGGSKSVPQILI